MQIVPLEGAGQRVRAHLSRPEVLTCYPLCSVVRFMQHNSLLEVFMKLLKLSLAVVLATTLAGTAWSQSSTPQILGYLNPANNSFRPLGVQSVAGPAVTIPQLAFTGTISVTFTITVKSTIPSTTSITCTVSAEVVDPQNIISEEAAVIATRSGSKATCTVSIPYSWLLTASLAPTEKAVLTYVIGTVPTTTAPGLQLRISSQEIAIITVPKTGTNTFEKVNATI
jgi:hypothetical protein